MKKPSSPKGAAAPRASYDPAKIEKKWQKEWAKKKLYTSKESASKEKFYILDMFPYPSGEGLHVGHPKGYIATDVISRMKRMQGKNVLHPMGFDAFGLPAENYAIKMKTHPEVQVKKNITRYKEQLELLGFDYDWSREVNTTDSTYYKWTQWIFLQLWKKGLAFESNEPINWCPSCKTGLANEDLDDGRCERCGTPVEKKPLRQWVLQITKYADRLLQDLDIKVLPNGDYFMLNDKGEPSVVQMNEIDPGKVRTDKKFVERDAITAFIEHWEGDKFMVLKWKKVSWMTPLTGGIEKDQTAEEAARREILEETGFKNVELVKVADKRMHSTFFHVPKDENRVGHFTCFHFKLKNGEQAPISKEEQGNHEITWVERSKVRSTLTAVAQQMAWALLMNEPVAESAKPLLDWPESIKELQRNWIGRSEGAEIDFDLRLTKNKPRMVILHGYKESPQTQFFPWIKKEFEALGHEVQVPQLPHAAEPTEAEQVDFVLKNCAIDENTVIIGHSLGATLAMKVLMKLQKPISGLLLVAPAFDPNFGTPWKPRSFHKTFSWDINYELIQKLTGGKIAVLADTREVERAPYLRHLAKFLNSACIEAESVEKHFVAAEEPMILKCCTPEVKVFTTRPDTIFGVTYIVLAPEHMWVGEFMDRLENKAEVQAYVEAAKTKTSIDRTDATKEKTGVELKGIKAVNPATGEEVPVWVSDYVLADYGTGAVMAVPAHDDRDFAFAKKYKLPIRQVIVPEFGEKRANEERRDGVCAFIFNPKTQKYASLKDIHGAYRLCTGGLDAGEKPEDCVKREVEEETGLHDFESVKKIAEADIHFYNKLKNVNRVARSTAYLIVLKSDAVKPTKLEPGEQFTLEWHSPDELLKNWETSFTNNADHWIWWLQLAVGRLIESGIDKTSDPAKFKPMAYTGGGTLTNSKEFNGRPNESVMQEITEFASGRWVAQYKLRDWVFSRQRYWGEPIPLIHCPKCGVVAVPEKDLPVKLPNVKSYEPTGTGESPLAAIDKWVNVKCPECGTKAKRETNTMPQWAGSCWYYLRYEDPKNARKLVDPTKERYWSPVDLYVGGAEHATRHLIYARFWHKFLYDIGVVSHIEPFTKLQSVGLIMGEDGRKMGKRYGNVVNPDDVVAVYGADTLRVYEMFMGPFDQQIAWSTSSMVGARRFIERIWKLAEKVTADASSQRIIHKTVKKVTKDISDMAFNTAISSMMICTNELEKVPAVSRVDYEALLKLLAPFAPHVAEELWTSLGNKKSIHVSEWPSYDEKMTVENTATIILQVNGKVRGSFTSPIDASKETLENMAKSLPEAQKWLNGKAPQRVIVVPGKLVNIVV